MSTTYNINGFIDVRIPIIDEDFDCAGGRSPAQVAAFYCELFKIKLRHSCEVINHELQIEEIG